MGRTRVGRTEKIYSPRRDGFHIAGKNNALKALHQTENRQPSLRPDKKWAAEKQKKRRNKNENVQNRAAVLMLGPLIRCVEVMGIIA